VLILNNLARREEASIIGKGTLWYYPDFGALYVATAYALRNFSGPADVKTLIAAGEPLLEEEAIFHYMLACYDSALGNLGEAKEGLQRTFELDPAFKLKALDGPDLSPVGIRFNNALNARLRAPAGC